MAVSENDLIVGPLTPAAGVTTISLDYYFEDAGWLEVYKTGSETPLVINTDYTVAGEGTSSGVVTLTTPANGTDAYSVYLAVPLQRSSDMQLRGQFKSGPFNVELDRVWQALMRHETLISRTVRLRSTTSYLAPFLPTAKQTGYALVWGADGNLENSEVDVAAQAAAAQAAQEAAELAQAAAEASEGAAEVARTQAELAAIAAGAALFDSVANGLAGTSDTDVFLVSTTPGVQVYRNDAGSETFLGWLGEVLFDDAPALLDYPHTLAEGTIIRTRREGFSYEVAASAATDHHVATAGGAKLYMAGQEYFFTQVLDGTETSAERSTKLKDFLQAAHDDNRPAVIDGGRGTTHTISGDQNVSLASDLSIRFDGAKLNVTNIFGLRGETVATGRALTADADWETSFVTLDDVTGIEPGMMLRLTTSTQVITTFPTYYKQANAIVVAVDGFIVELNRVLPFDFTTAETSVAIYKAPAVFIDGLHLEGSGRFDLSQLHGSVLRDPYISGTGKTGNDPMFLSSAMHTTFYNAQITSARYGVNISNGSVDTIFRGVRGWDCRHPIDPNVWSFGTYVYDFEFWDTQGSIHSHPCFELHFDRGTFDGGFGQRAIGSSLKNARSVESSPVGPTESQTPIGLLAAYDYLQARINFYYENVKAPNVHIGFSEGQFAEIKRTHFNYLNNDSNGCNIVYVHDDCVIENPGSFGRFRKMQKDGPIEQKSIHAFEDAGMAQVITGITQANPAVVTVAGHGLTTGQSVLIESVSGMTEINGQWSEITVLDADTFEMDWIDSTGYTAYSSGGTATDGVAVISCDVATAANRWLVGTIPKIHLVTDLLEGVSSGTVSLLQPKKFRLRPIPYTRTDGFNMRYAYGEMIITVGGRFDSFVQKRIRMWYNDGGSMVFGTPETITQFATEDITISNLTYTNLGKGYRFEQITFDWALTNWGSLNWINTARVEFLAYEANPSHFIDLGG